MKKGTGKILIGIVLALAGLLVIPVAVIAPAIPAGSQSVTFLVPGQARLEALEPGRFYLWHEHETVFDGERRVAGERLPDGLRMEVRRLDENRALAFESNASMSTTSGSNASRSIGYVEVERPGTLEVEVTGGDDQQRVFTFARMRFWEIARAIGLGLVSILLIGSAGIGVLIWGIVERNR